MWCEYLAPWVPAVCSCLDPVGMPLPVQPSSMLCGRITRQAAVGDKEQALNILSRGSKRVLLSSPNASKCFYYFLKLLTSIKNNHTSLFHIVFKLACCSSYSVPPRLLLSAGTWSQMATGNYILTLCSMSCYLHILGCKIWFSFASSYPYNPSRVLPNFLQPVLCW